MLLVDSHLDLAWNDREWHRDVTGEIAEIRAGEQGQHGIGRARNTVSIPEMRRAEIGLFIGTLLSRRVVEQTPPFIPFETPDLARQAALSQLDFYLEMSESELLRTIRTASELDGHLEQWQRESDQTPLGLVLSMEGADGVRAPDDLEDWWGRGLRIIGPVHYGVNQYSHGTGSDGGLKQLGRSLLRQMDALGYVLDVTHLSDLAFDESLDLFTGPVLASHHNCRTLVPGQRQLSDDQIRALLERGAVIGVASDAWMLQPGWVRAETAPTVGIAAMADHIDHICQLAGNSQHAAIGSDLDGGFGTEQCPTDLDTIRDLQSLTGILLTRGYQEVDVRNVMHANWIRLLRNALAP